MNDLSNVVAPSATQTKDRFTVHNYTTLSSRGGSSELLSTAQDLIKTSSTRHKSEWRTMRETEMVIWIPKKLYMYSISPPRLPKDEHHSVEELKEWGTAVQDVERWSLVDLADFSSSDFTVNSRANESHTVKNKSLRESDGKRALTVESETSASISAAPPAKRRKRDDRPLYNVIPRPHMYPSLPLNGKTTAPALKPYKRTTPIILAPYTDPQPPPGPYDRRAWMIPVRGVLSWERSTPAELLDERDARPVPPAPKSLQPIVWTRGAVLAFWDFVKALRESGKLGSLGIAFHASGHHRDGTATATGTSSSGTREHEGQGWQRSVVSEKNGGSAAKGDSQRRATLSSVDHIKVYHDADKSMILRTALDAWSYDMRDGSAKLRMLKGAKLVLLDHLSRGVLIS